MPNKKSENIVRIDGMEKRRIDKEYCFLIKTLIKKSFSTTTSTQKVAEKFKFIRFSHRKIYFHNR